MTTFRIIDLSPDAQRALAMRAYANNRTPQDEIRAILNEVLHPKAPLQLGTLLSSHSRASGLSNEDVELLEHIRAADPAPPMWFG